MDGSRVHSENDKEQPQYTEPVGWTCGKEKSLQHAVLCDDPGEIKRLLDTGTNVNSKFSCNGETALITALKSDKFKAVKVLLDSDADVQASDPETGKTALQICVTKWEYKEAEDIVPHVMANLNRSNFDTGTLVEVLTGGGDLSQSCKNVLSVSDARVTREFLKRNNSLAHGALMHLAMNKKDMKNVELILRYGAPSAILNFYMDLDNLHRIKDMVSWKAFIERLADDWDWAIANEEALKQFDIMFRNAGAEYLKILLDFNIPAKVREKMGSDLRTSIFGNGRVNAVELLENENFNVNALGYKQQTALHFAVKQDLLGHVQFLLDSGADVDIKDDHGWTPLFHCVEWKSKSSGMLLLEYGANVQAVDNKGMTVFEFADNKYSSLKECLIAQLVIGVVQGVPTKQAIQRRIDHDPKNKKIYDTCYQQLQTLQECEIVKNVSLFTVLVETIEAISQFVSNEDVFPLVDQYLDKYGLHYSLYVSALITKLTKSLNRYRFKCKIADLISKCTGNLIDFNHPVVTKISKYVSQRDVDNFLEWK